MEWLKYISDETIFNFATKAATDYTVLSGLLLGPAVFFAWKIVKKTPWKSDDILLEKMAKMFGISKEE